MEDLQQKEALIFKKGSVCFKEGEKSPSVTQFKGFICIISWGEIERAREDAIEKVRERESEKEKERERERKRE